MSETEDQPTQWAPKNNSKLLLVGLLGMAAAMSGKSVPEVLDEIGLGKIDGDTVEES